MYLFKELVLNVRIKDYGIQNKFLYFKVGSFMARNMSHPSLVPANASDPRPGSLDRTNTDTRTNDIPKSKRENEPSSSRSPRNYSNSSERYQDRSSSQRDRESSRRDPRSRDSRRLRDTESRQRDTESRQRDTESRQRDTESKQRDRDKDRSPRVRDRDRDYKSSSSR